MNARNCLQLTLLAAMAATSFTAAAQSIMPAKEGIDPNTFVVGHPASPRWKVVRVGNEHPAVALARAGQAGVNANTFIVQPPAGVTWLLASAETAPVQLTAAALLSAKAGR